MKILFAVNNDNISETISRKYQKDYKEILSYKNVYYFNAILRELQKDKSYSRIVISEDLEPFANNNYDSIDKFLFDKYSAISEEAKSINNEKIDIILICADRRKKTDSMLTKIFKKNIYNALIGQDRSIDEVCRLINSPRDKEEAKRYYHIQESELGDTESEDSVSEAEVENIRAHYARLGRNEDKYVESFNNIVAQYSDTQLKIIIKYLPLHVKAVLEERSPKYQQLVTTSALDGVDAKLKTTRYKEQLKNKQEDDVVSQFIKPKNIKSVVIPTNLSTKNVQKVVIPKIEKPEINVEDIKIERKQEDEPEKIETTKSNEEIRERLLVKEETEMEDVVEQPKRGRGRPRKYPPKEEIQDDKPKRGRGRPRKYPIEDVKNQEQIKEDEPEEENEEVYLFDIDEQLEPETVKEVDLFNMEDEPETDEEEINLFETDEVNEEEIEDEEPEFDEEESEIEEDDDETMETSEQETDLFDFAEEENEEAEVPENVEILDMPEETHIPEETDKEVPKIENDARFEEKQELTRTSNTTSNLSTLLTGDKKIVAFVGTTKNGTSFVVNNTAEMLSSMGIETAVLDMTKTKNSYYIYTNNEEELRTIARNCMDNLENGRAEGIKPHRYLSIYTEMPGEEQEHNIEQILATLVSNHSAILIDTDFDTIPEIFEKAQEIYLVQSMDVLTIQPLTAFLRNLKSKGILKPEKLKIVINKAERVRSLNTKTLIGGMANYNAPSMTYMTELFNKDNIKYCEIPFETQNYVKYLESLVICSISLNGYTKQLISSLKELANMVYPLVSKQQFGPTKDNRENIFSSQVNDTLNKMKRQY